jgi:predicted AlkP superfamily pyrophosphatase or phosphodiesterase
VLAPRGAAVLQGWLVTPPALVILLSIDGLGADYVDDPTLDLPALRGLAARGPAPGGSRRSSRR